MESRAGEVVILRLEGKLDAATGPELEASVDRMLAAGSPRMVLDGAGLAYVSSAGLRSILRSAKRAASDGGALVIAGLPPGPRHVIGVAGLGDIIGVHATTEEAVAAAASSEGTEPREGPAAPSSGLTLVEEMTLLSIDRSSGRLLPSAVVLHHALAGAALADLMLMNRIDTDVDQITTLDATPVGHPVLDAALRDVASLKPPRKVAAALVALSDAGGALLDRVVDNLVGHGILRREENRLRRVLGIQRYQTADGRQRREVGERLTELVAGNGIPDLRDAVLVGLVDIAGLSPVVFSDPAVAGRRARIESLARLDVVGVGVTRALQRVLDPIAAAYAIMRA